MDEANAICRRAHPARRPDGPDHFDDSSRACQPRAFWNRACIYQRIGSPPCKTRFHAEKNITTIAAIFDESVGALEKAWIGPTRDRPAGIGGVFRALVA